MNAPLDQVLSAVCDPTRRAILQRLSHGPARVTDVAEPLPMSLAAVSKHVRVLEDAGLVRRERQGREHLLHLDAAIPGQECVAAAVVVMTVIPALNRTLWRQPSSRCLRRAA